MGTLAWYRDSGTDYSGNGHNLVPINEWEILVGEPLIGTNPSIRIDDTARLELPNFIPYGPISWVLFFKMDSPNGVPIAIGEASNYCFLQVTSDRVYYAFNEAATLQYLHTFENDTVYHFALTTNGSRSKLYLNGVLVASADEELTQLLYNMAPPSPPNLFSIGGDSAGIADPFIGNIQNVGVFDHELTAEEVALYATGYDPFIPVASTDVPFPTEVWDGTTPTRERSDIYAAPSGEDWNTVFAELAATQQHLITLKDADGVVTLAPEVTKGSDPVAAKINDELTVTTKDIIVSVGGDAVASVDLGYDIPAGSLVLAAAANIESAITLAVATKIGIGIAGSLAKYGSITGGAKNSKSTLAITPTAIASSEDVKIYATDNSNAAAGTIQNGSIRVRLTILTQGALADAP